MSVDNTAAVGADEINILNLQFVHIERFAFVMKALVESGLLDEAVKHLRSRGCEMLAISVEPVFEMQAMLRERSAARGGADSVDDQTSSDEARALDQRLGAFERSNCGPKYPPRPPDHWPPGPWDPPR